MCAAASDDARLRGLPVAHTVLVAPGMKDADHPRILELVLGRMLELVVFSVEGVRGRFVRPRALIH
jgi:hypothetical protein